MARPSLKQINSNLQQHDAAINDNFEALTAAPLPIAEHTGSPGDESDLEATFPAAQHDRCAIMVQHSVHGWVAMFSDGVAWRVIPKRADAVADIEPASPPPTETELAEKLNELLAALRTSGVLTP